MPESWPKLASCLRLLGANQREAIHVLKAAMAWRSVMWKGRTLSGQIMLAAAVRGTLTRWVAQKGHAVVSTLSSMRTLAPQPGQRTSLERPAMVPWSVTALA